MQQRVDLIAFEFGDHCVQYLLLTLDPARIAAPVVAKAHVGDRLRSVEVLQPLLEVNVQVPPAIVVVDRLAGTAGVVLEAIGRLDDDIQTADRVDDVLRGIDAQHDVAIEIRDPEEARDDLLGFFNAAVGLGLIDLGLRAVRHRRNHVARNRQLIDALVIEIDVHRPNRIAARVGRELHILIRVIVVQAFDEHQNARFTEDLLRRRYEDLRDRQNRILVLEDRVTRRGRGEAEREQAENQDDAAPNRIAALRSFVLRSREMLTQRRRVPARPRDRRNRTDRGLRALPKRSRPAARRR